MALWIIISIIVLGIILLLFEMFFIPGSGVTGIIGILLIIAGVIMGFSRSEKMGFITLGVTAIVLVFILIRAFKPETWKSVALKDEIKGKVDINQAEGLKVGDRGVAISRLAPMGKAKFGKRYAEVQSFDNLIDERTQIEIVQIDGNDIYVKPI